MQKLKQMTVDRDTWRNVATEAVQELQIAQGLTGLRVMPHMLPTLEDMAARGDKIAAEVVRRFKLEKGQPT
jgi:hypothetical protein